MQAAYEEFGCNDGNVFFMGIDKGNTNEAVIYYDSVYGVHYPGVSGQNGGGNGVHLLYEVQATPTVIVIQPDKVIAVKQIWPPATMSVVDSVVGAGGILQECLTDILSSYTKNILSIVPNPAKDFAYLDLDLPEDEDIRIEIYNFTGKKVMGIIPARSTSGKYYIKIDFTNRPGGLYFVKVLTNNKLMASKKLLLHK